MWADDSVVLEQTAECGRVPAIRRVTYRWRWRRTSLRAELSEKYLKEETSRKTRLAEIVQVTKGEMTCLMPRSRVPALLENVSACHMSFYQGHLHTPLTEVLLKSCCPCTSMPLVRGRSRLLRGAVLVLLCRSSEDVVYRCGLQNEYPWHLLLFLWRCRVVSATSAKIKIYRPYIVPRFYTISNYFFLSVT